MHKLLSLAACFTLLLTIPASVSAYVFQGERKAVSSNDCIICHTAEDGASLHGNFSITSNQCSTCHSVHTSQGTKLLLGKANGPEQFLSYSPEEAITASCITCHDLTTSERGVYNIGTDSGFGHRVPGTPGFTSPIISIPYGAPGDRAPLQNGPNKEFGASRGVKPLSCASCHSPHASNLVDPFFSDSARAGSQPTSKLLRRYLYGPSLTATYVSAYGPDWCAACHVGAVESHYLTATVQETVYAGIHPIAPLSPEDGYRPFDLAGSNAGYIFAPVTMNSDGHRSPRPSAPLCQECHSHARNLSAPFERAYDGEIRFEYGLNPRYLSFPHRSANPYLLVSQSICGNCHPWYVPAQQ